MVCMQYENDQKSPSGCGSRKIPLGPHPSDRQRMGVVWADGSRFLAIFRL